MNFSIGSLRKLSTCDDKLKTVFMEAIKESPLDFGISCGYRTPEEQQGLYAQGRTVPGKIVTQIDGITKKSKHNYNPSKAVDIIVYVDGKITWEDDKYIKVATHVLSVAKKLNINISYGGNWINFKDYPHFEVA